MANAYSNSPIAHARLEAIDQNRITLSLPGTEYRLDFQVADASALPSVGSLVCGRVTAKAKRVDVIDAGGRLVEPIYGRPRRIQGRIIQTDASANTITVLATLAITCTLEAPQQAGQFAVGQMVSFDVQPGAGFELVQEHAAAH